MKKSTALLQVLRLAGGLVLAGWFGWMLISGGDILEWLNGVGPWHPVLAVASMLLALASAANTRGK